MKRVQLYINQVKDTKTIFFKSFHPLGIETSDQSDFPPDYKLYLSNNIDELISLKEGRSISDITPFFLDFHKDPDTRFGSFKPDSKKICPKFDYCLLTVWPPVSVESVDFYYKFR